MPFSLSSEAGNLPRKHRDLPMLENNANTWKQWNSVKQLTCHSQIRNELASFWEKVRTPLTLRLVFNSHPSQHTCHQHKFLSDQRFVTTDDESDLLSHLMYCGRKPELYQLSNQLAIIIELLWQVCGLSLELFHRQLILCSSSTNRRRMMSCVAYVPSSTACQESPHTFRLPCRLSLPL